MGYKQNHLENLPIDILKIILKNCDYDSLINIIDMGNVIKESVDKNLLNEKLREKRKIIKINKMYNFFPEHFKKIINFSKIIQSKLIKLGKEQKNSEYIDFLNLKHYAKHDTNIMFGRDIFNRFFISIMYDVDNDYYHEYKTNNIITFFQRFSEKDSFYIICGDSFIERGLINTFDFNNNKDKMEEQIRIFIELLNFGKSSFKKNNIILNYVLSQI